MAGKKMYIEFYGAGENGDDGETETFNDVKGVTVSVPEWIIVQDANDDVTYVKSETIKRMRLESDFLQGL
jgi:hypothetical protein